MASRFSAVSIEAVITSAFERGKKWIVDTVGAVVGIALLAGDEPAFRGARVAGVLYAHSVAHEIKEETTMDPSQLSFDQIVSEIKRRNIHAKQLFDFPSLMGKAVPMQDGSTRYIGGDSDFQDFVLSMQSQAQSAVKTELEKRIEDLEAQNKELSAQAEKLRRFEALPKVNELIGSIEDDRFKKFVSARAESFEPGDDVEKSAAEFVERQRKEYAQLQELMGIAPTPAPAPEQGKPATESTGPRVPTGRRQSGDTTETLYGVEV